MIPVARLRRMLALLALALAGCGETLTQQTTSVPSTPPEVLQPEPPKAEAVAKPATESNPTETAGARATEDATAPLTAAMPKKLDDAVHESSRPAPKAEPAKDQPKAGSPRADAAPGTANGPVALVPMTFDEFRSKVATNPKAKLTVVDAWATWCAPCKENFPHLVAMHKKYAAQGLNAVSLSMDDPTDPKAVAEATAFLRQQGATFTNVLLKEDFGTGFEKLDVNGIPAVFLYDPSGKEIRRFTGDDTRKQFTYEEVDQIVAKLLKGEPLPTDTPGEVRAAGAKK